MGCLILATLILILPASRVRIDTFGVSFNMSDSQDYNEINNAMLSIVDDFLNKKIFYRFKNSFNIVSPTKLWMKMSSPFARPVFIENHDQIMEQAILGFTHMIKQKQKSGSGLPNCSY